MNITVFIFQTLDNTTLDLPFEIGKNEMVFTQKNYCDYLFLKLHFLQKNFPRRQNLYLGGRGEG